MTNRRSLGFLIGGAVVLTLGAGVLVHSARLAMPPLVNTENILYQDEYRLNGAVAGDLVVVGSALTVETGASVGGDASFVGDRVTIRGAVDGDLSIAAGEIVIDNAAISGDAALIGRAVILSGSFAGSLNVSGDSVIIRDGTAIEGDVSACATKIEDERAASAEAATASGSGTIVPCAGDAVVEPLAALIALRTGETLVSAATGGALITGAVEVLLPFVLAGLTSLVVTLFPRQISRIEEAVRAEARRLGGLGIAVFILGTGLVLALIVALALLPPLGILLIPLYLIGGIALLVLVAAGWITLSLMIGDALARRLARSAARHSRPAHPPLIHAAAGSLLLSVSFALLSRLPFGEVITAFLGLIILSVGVGATLLTRLGTRPLNRVPLVQG
ncbi:MAG: polymer-forming cytoskeletal protein [bacterium]|nr:polymer-forming cytoskeletal protein [bacterium]